MALSDKVKGGLGRVSAMFRGPAGRPTTGVVVVTLIVLIIIAVILSLVPIIGLYITSVMAVGITFWLVKQLRAMGVLRGKRRILGKDRDMRRLEGILEGAGIAFASLPFIIAGVLQIGVVVLIIGAGLIVANIILARKPKPMGTYFRGLARWAGRHAPALRTLSLLGLFLSFLLLWFVAKTPWEYIVLFFFIALFFYGASRGTVTGILAVLPLLIFGWLIASGWFAIVASLAAPVLAPLSISTEPLFEQASAFFADVGLLITNPTSWYEKQFVQKGKREEEATPQALEINKIEALPNSMFPGDRFDIVFEMENKGREPAQLREITAFLDDPSWKNGGAIITPEGQEKFEAHKIVLQAERAIVIQGEKRFLAIGAKAPSCSGSFTAGGKLTYDYNVRATTNLQIASREYYRTELEAGRLKFVDPLSTSSAGPFKITLRTDRQQPIPATEVATVGTTPAATKFRLFIGIVNEREGDALIKDLVVLIPSEILPDINEKGCELFDETLSIPALTKDTRAYRIKSFYKQYKEEKGGWVKDTSVQQGKLEFREDVNKSRRLIPKLQTRFWGCDFVPQVSPEQTKTYFVATHVDYTFNIEKKLPYTVQQIGATPTNCAEQKKRVLSTESAGLQRVETGVPVSSESLLKTLAGEICLCSRNWGGDSADCGTLKINTLGCDPGKSEYQVFLNGIVAEAGKNPECKRFKGDFTKIDFEGEKEAQFYNTIKKEPVSFTGNIPKDESKNILLYPNLTYSVNIRSDRPEWYDVQGRESVKVKFSSSAKDTLECNSGDGSPCENELSCASFNCKKGELYAAAANAELGKLFDTFVDNLAKAIQVILPAMTREQVIKERDWLKNPPPLVCVPKEATFSKIGGAPCASGYECQSGKCEQGKCGGRAGTKQLSASAPILANVIDGARTFTPIACSSAEQQIFFDWTNKEPLGCTKVGKDQYTVQFESKIKIPDGGKYICVESDDGVQVIIGGIGRIDKWKDVAGEQKMCTKDKVSAGEWKLTVNHFQIDGPSKIKLLWSDTSDISAAQPVSIDAYLQP